MIEEAEVIKPQFKPDVDYQWMPEDSLTVKGQELALLHNTLHTVFTEDVPDSKAWVMLHALYKVTTEIIKRGVEDGVIKEKK